MNRETARTTSSSGRLSICVIGGGPAGMAAAWTASSCGAGVTLLERAEQLGGVLPQCIHNGFGTQILHADLTGGEYAARWEERVRQRDIDVRLGATVMSAQECSGDDRERAEDPRRGGWLVHYVDARSGSALLRCDAVILACGCRERTLPQMDIPGSRPAGIFTAGEAQQMMNLENYLPGRSAVILGSGDIGLIMARRLTLEGIPVKMILGEKASGLARNVVQCVRDFDLPLRYGWTVASTHGYKRLKGVNIREVNGSGREYIPCDMLLLAAGLVPDTAAFANCLGRPGFVVCGNADHVFDLVDHVTVSAVRAAVRVCGVREEELPADVRRLLEADLPQQKKDRQGNMVCTVCPQSCVLQVRESPFAVTGQGCPRGEAFARQELSDPRRVVTTVLRVRAEAAPDLPETVSVRTGGTVSRAEIPAVMRAARRTVIDHPVRIGDEIRGGAYTFVVTSNRCDGRPASH